MQDTEALRICRLTEKKLRPLLGIGPEWSIFWFIREKGEPHRGECDTSPEYRRAIINIYTNNIDSRDELIEVAAHELAHVAQWPFDLARELVTGEEASAVVKRAWHHAFEQHVEAVLLPSRPVREAIKQLQAEARAMKK